MNINELNGINAINIEDEIADMEAGSGTFKDILDNVYAGRITPIANHAGDIIGLNYDAHATNIVEDNIAAAKFAKSYEDKDLMKWVYAAFKLRSDCAIISDVHEDDDGIWVTLSDGNVVAIESHEEDSTDEIYADSLPDHVEISMDDLNGSCDEKAVYKYLRDTYNHFLSGADEKPEISVDFDFDTVHVSNIHWGRKR